MKRRSKSTCKVTDFENENEIKHYNETLETQSQKDNRIIFKSKMQTV